MDFVKVETSELIGPALDWAVGSAQGWVTYPNDSIERGDVWHTDPAKAPFGRIIRVENFQPSTDWVLGGPLIENHRIELRTSGTENWYADKSMIREGGDDWCGHGPSALIAACRAIVSGKFGDTVNVPAKLVR